MSQLWLFDFDAEDELAARRSRTAFRRASASVVRARADALAALARPVKDGGLLRPGDEVLVGGSSVQGQGHRCGAAWCPTPSALERLAAAGSVLLDAPCPEVLIEANARETFAAIAPLPGATVVDSVHGLRAAVERRAPGRAPGVGREPAWVLRRSLCASGRGRLICDRFDDRAARWAAVALALGPVEVQPLVDAGEEFAQHGRVDRRGRVALGRAVRQSVEGSAWRAAELAPPASLSDVERASLHEAADDVGRRLRALGYFGPFGVDAFRWTDGSGREHFQAATDVNARYTMSFAIGAPELV